jgi:hypothetical protein
MAEGKTGVVRIVVDGDWDMEDLRSLSESMSESYGLLYPLVATDEEVRSRLQDLIRKQFWSGDMQSRHFGQCLYKSIPKDETLRLKSFHYSSLGAMELAGYLGAVLLAARVAKAWIAAGGDFIDLWAKSRNFSTVGRVSASPPVKSSSMTISSWEATKRGSSCSMSELGSGSTRFPAKNSWRLSAILFPRSSFSSRSGTRAEARYVAGKRALTASAAR